MFKEMEMPTPCEPCGDGYPEDSPDAEGIKEDLKEEMK